ncbi:hypothetical protein J5X98_12675 [Leptothermofonsia sichuanensis E412]|uniref:hypothetical protein n=1 Tax=Leptothermofonsia sichuanensis TaxID=2917832 RepID=UPI001CA629BA|nr:hypothetical protein [Leptothermofonsia sichuanensis]QZZ23106.1 hypothetical protein J5X98_12675 [Leptothermofonsia sichuanensis E412]
MKPVAQKWSMNLNWKYGTFGVLGTLILSGLAMKPTSISIARSPKAMPGNEAQISQATADARSQQRQEQTRQIRPENYDLNQFPVANLHEKHWRNILWTTAVVEPQDSFVVEAIDQILGLMTRSGLSNGQMRTVDAATKVATQLYLRYPDTYGKFEQRFLQAIEGSRDPEWVAVSLSALVRGGMPLAQVQSLIERVKGRFPGWNKNVHLYTTIREVAELTDPGEMPPLGDLLKWEVAPRQLHLYVLCRPNRDVLCQAMLKDRDGQFVRHGDGKLWSTPLLLRSIHNLNWNFVRGQTPQGIFRIEGIVPQPDDLFFRAYGRFSLVKLFVPFEPGAKQFLPGKSGPFQGDLKDYQNLLPPSWRNHWAIQQSFWAGKAGRSEFRIHGTGEAPDFFSNKGNNPASFSWNPTIGCLSALELYNENGQLVDAHMPRILEALRMVGGNNFAGYMIVAEVPGASEQPISLQEVETALLRKAETTSASSQVKSTSKPKAINQPKSAQVEPPAQPTPEPATTTLDLKPILDQNSSKEAGKSVPISHQPSAPETTLKPENIPLPTRNPDELEAGESIPPLPIAY